MKNLGKIVLLLLLPLYLFGAGVQATLDRAVVEVGEYVTLSLTINGKDIKKPNLTQICGSEVVSTSSQTSIRMVNGQYSKNYILSYKFQPTKSCKIDPIDVVIGNQTYKTNVLELRVVPFKRSKNDPFTLTLTTDKKELYIGESFHLRVTLKQKLGAEVADSRFVAPNLKGFWVKKESKPKQSQQGDTIVTTIDYTLAPQRAGELKIAPAQIQIASRAQSSMDMWSSFMPELRWKSYFSNALELQVKPLPNNVKLVGNFTIGMSVDKQKVKANEPVNIAITVKGDGNLEDIESFEPTLDGVSVFADKIKISGDTLTQKIAMVADENFTIPPFELVFFDLKTKTTKRVATKPLSIEVVTPPKQKQQTTPSVISAPKQIQNEIATTSQQPLQKAQEFNLLVLLGVFVMGVAIGIVLGYKRVWQKVVKPKEKSYSLKDEKYLLVKLMPYKEDEKVAKIIETLEAKLYLGKDVSVNKKELKEVLKKYAL